QEATTVPPAPYLNTHAASPGHRHPQAPRQMARTSLAMMVRQRPLPIFRHRGAGAAGWPIP
ncbi:MAG: hypothetical protein ACJ8AW_10185, partial [Rhodopila sp.]